MIEQTTRKRWWRPSRTYIESLITILPAVVILWGGLLLKIGAFISLGLAFAALAISWLVRWFLDSRREDRPRESVVFVLAAFAVMTAMAVFFLYVGFSLRAGRL